MKKLFSIVIIGVFLLNISVYAKEYKVYEVENNKEITIKTFEKLFNKVNQPFYLDDKRVDTILINSQKSKNNKYHYIGYSDDGRYFFETLFNTKTEETTEKVKETTKETTKEITKETTKEAVKETTKAVETTIKEIIVTPQSTLPIVPKETYSQLEEEENNPYIIYKPKRLNSWISSYNRQTFDLDTLYDKFQELAESVYIYISSVELKRTFEFKSDTITREDLITIYSKSKNPNFEIICQDGDKEIYISN